MLNEAPESSSSSQSEEYDSADSGSALHSPKSGEATKDGSQPEAQPRRSQRLQGKHVNVKF